MTYTEGQRRIEAAGARLTVQSSHRCVTKKTWSSGNGSKGVISLKSGDWAVHLRAAVSLGKIRDLAEVSRVKRGTGGTEVGLSEVTSRQWRAFS